MDKTLINAAIADSRVQKGISVYLTMCLKVSWMMLRVTAGGQSKERNHVDCILMAADVDRRISRICAGSTAPALKQSEQDITSWAGNTNVPGSLRWGLRDTAFRHVRAAAEPWVQDTQSLNNEYDGMQCWEVWIPKSVFWKSVPSEAVAFTCPWRMTVLVSFHVCILLGLQFPAMLLACLFTLFLCLLVINEISHLVKNQSALVPYMAFLLHTHEHAHIQRAR